MASEADWKAELRLEHPAWDPYRTLLDRLPQDEFPTPHTLQTLLSAAVRTQSGRPIRFTPAAALDATLGYEEEIAASGRVSTRSDDLHDLCNALVWARFPALKAALNARHLDALPTSTSGRRGPVRDALTLFDECGLLVTSADRAPLERLAAHDWRGLFGPAGEAWPETMRVHCVGHANLEKLCRPYKGMTGRCLLLHTPGDELDLEKLDAIMARCWAPAGPLARPADLCPLPHAGIPGWWTGGAQDVAFYDDPEVFRLPREGRVPPPVWSTASLTA